MCECLLPELVAGLYFSEDRPVTASTWEAPSPVLFNTWKHHAAWLRDRVHAAAGVGPSALDGLAANLVVIGTELMDLYLGAMSPAEIGESVLRELRAAGVRTLADYRDLVVGAGGYHMLTLPRDGCRWCLRMGDEADRYVHVHPGRYAPNTRRVRANVLKTAVIALAVAGVNGGDPMDRVLVNEVRRRYLGLAPVGRDLDGDQGLGAVIDLLK